MEKYRHPLFFEAKLTSDIEKKKVWIYFQKRRDSGGGECGSICCVGGDVYRINFEKEEDQERVLQRKHHTIFLPTGKLQVTVSRGNVPKNLAPTDPSSRNQSALRKPSQTNTECLEKTLPVQISLLNYLRDNAKALAILQRQLSCIGSTAEFDLDGETATVRGDIDQVPGGAFGGAAETWALQVERVFHGFNERHLCYHVTDPDMRRTLHADPSLFPEDVRVYKEVGYDVIVGDAETVKRKVATLEKNMPTRRELPIVEKQYELIEEEFKQEMRASCPQVKVCRGTGKILLEGPDKEVQVGVRKLEEMLQKIKVKRMCPCDDLMVFLAKSGAISKFQSRFQQNLRSRVTLDAGSELVFSSLSSEALVEAEATLRSEVMYATEKIQGTAAVPPELDRLKEILSKAKDEANRHEPRVGINFLPVPGRASEVEVLLVGYTDSVSRLRDLLIDYQMNQVQTQEVLDLPDPEMLDCFDQILGLIGMKTHQVTLKASPFPRPCVLVSGPLRLVRETLEGLRSTLLSLWTSKLILDGPGARLYFQTDGRDNKELVETSCQVIIRAQSGAERAEGVGRSLLGASAEASPGDAAQTINKINVEVKLGRLEEQQVDVLVGPMLNKKPSSTKIGRCLLGKTDKKNQSGLFSSANISSLDPGGVLHVNWSMNLGCANVFFIECVPWDGVGGRSVTALAAGLKCCLELCVQQGFRSVAFPIIGPGVLLGYSPAEAIRALAESVHQFAGSASTGSLSTIRIVVRPDYPDSQCYRKVCWQLSRYQNQRAVFKSLSGDLDDIRVRLEGGVEVELVRGDITRQTADAIVNTANFPNSQYGAVSKGIFALAGPAVEAEVKAVRINPGDIYLSQPGLAPCQALLHVCREQEPQRVEKLTSQIIEYCESSDFGSVALTSICGVGVLDPGAVASAMLRGVKAATSATSFSSLTNVRIVLIDISTFLAFRKEAMQSFPTANITQVWSPDLSSMEQQQQQQEPPRPTRTDLSIPLSTKSQSVFHFLGLSKEDVDYAMAKLKSMYEAQSSRQTFKKAEVEGLTQEDTDKLQQLVESQGLSLEADPSCPGGVVVSGSKDGVNLVMQMINASLRREVRHKEEDQLYARVAWCILGRDGNWERLPKAANYALERKELSGRIADARGLEWTAQLQTMEATRDGTQSAKLKRLENLPDFTLPLYWDSMAPNEALKVVSLDHSSAEYQRVRADFKRTVRKSVIKIERLQNVHLRRAYEVQKKCIAEKNGDPGEKLLYHGTKQGNCDSIMKTGFDRGFAGRNATSYGHGCYFAVNAQYSANAAYSTPALNGVQLMFVARVLTGVYTQGHSEMRVRPKRGPQQPDLYDSVVDNVSNPSIYVVFHDSQAYPEYLISFK